MEIDRTSGTCGQYPAPGCLDVGGSLSSNMPGFVEESGIENFDNHYHKHSEEIHCEAVQKVTIDLWMP